MPSVHRSFYTDMVHGGAYWTFISEEVPTVARSLFHLSERREDNYVAGLSMGGYGAFKLALRCPERFAAAASMSGALDLREPPTERVDEWWRLMSNVFGAPEKVVGTHNDLFYLASELAGSGATRPRLYQCCGTEDFLYEDNIRFRDHARAIGLDVTYEEGPGEHEWGYWDQQIQRVLEWMELR